MRVFTQLPHSVSVLLIGAGLFFQVPCTSAQAREPGTSGSIREEIPNAPEPQSEAVSVQTSDDHPGNAQSQRPEQIRDRRVEGQHDGLPDRARACLSGTVTDTNGNVVPGATILLEGLQPEDRRTGTASETGGFQFDGLKPRIPYRVTIEARGLETWKSESIILDPGQYFFMKEPKLKVPDLVTSVTVYATREQIATKQVNIEIKQRVFGFIPNFYVTYDREPVPLTTRLKFKLAVKADTDPVTFVGVAFMAGIYQAGDVPNYGQGALGFAKRVGAGYADTTTDIFLGGAVYPWIFRQDPRYFYRGTGTVKSRILNALSSPYVCKGDNGKRQPNYSSIGGDLTSGAISNLYYPESDRGASLLFEGFAVTTGVRTVGALIQEFLLRKLTPSARAKY